MMDDCYREERREHFAKEYGKVAVNSGDNFAIIEKNDSERGVLYRQGEKRRGIAQRCD